MTLADRITILRLLIAPLAVASWLYAPQPLGYWGCALLCGFAELTDWLDGRVARARGEVTDFGKLADPFCDVIYRLSVFMALVLPAAGLGFSVTHNTPVYGQVIAQTAWLDSGSAQVGAGLMPWLPVGLMVIRELIAGALRAMCAAKGLVLAARTSGKIKAWLQGVALIFPLAAIAVLGWGPDKALPVAAALCWLAALVSVASMVEYIYVNRRILATLGNPSEK